MSPGQESVDKYLNANYPSEVEAYKNDLRAKVEALYTGAVLWTDGSRHLYVLRDDVLDLIDGGAR